MATSYQTIRSLLDANRHSYMNHPHHESLYLAQKGDSGRFFMLWLNLTSDGFWVQLRSTSYSECPANHPHLAAMHRLLATLNFDLRGIKFSWDQQDGEISAVADLLLGDAELTSSQLIGWIGFFFHQLDQAQPRVQAVQETGKDPGWPPQQEELV